MSQPAVITAGGPQSKLDVPPHDRLLPVLLLLFVGSGCASLIYEIVWYQMLQLVIGSTAVSLGVLLGTFMGGMCLGSVLLPRAVGTGRHPLRVYASLELGIGVIGILTLHGMPLVSRLYTSHFAPGMAGFLLRGLVAAICLLPPTLLMGATLPAIARWVKTTPCGVSWLGFFYGGNTVGAAFGCLLAGFYLLRVHDVAIATYCAAGINLGVALLALGIAPLAARGIPQTDPSSPLSTFEFPAQVPGAGFIYLVIAFSGLSALGAEVIWTRLLCLLLGGTVYTFSIILAVLLMGLVIGSSVGAMAARLIQNPRTVLGCCQILLAGAVAWAARSLSQSLPYWPISVHLGTPPLYLFQSDLARCAWAIFPAACLWGGSFPLALASAARQGADPGRLVGGVYAANTLGAIIGALFFSLIGIPLFGTQHAQQILIGICGLAGLVALTPKIRINLLVLKLVPCTVLVGALIYAVTPTPWQLVAYGRDISIDDYAVEALYVGEGMNSTVAVTRGSDDTRYFHVAGKCEASTIPVDMRLQLMLGHIPAMLHANPRSALVVGCGAGVTAGTFTLYPLMKITICEIEPLIPQHVTPFFQKENEGIMSYPLLTLVNDDARHFVLTTDQKFDIITSDPIHPWVKGAASLYTREYFQMVKDHLNPHGLVTQWVPLYETDEQTVKAEMATFLQVFPDVTFWANNQDEQGYDMVMLGSADDSMKIDLDAIQRRMNDPALAKAMNALKSVGFSNAFDLLKVYAGNAKGLTPWLADAEVNTDKNLRLQYVAGMVNNVQIADEIYQDIIKFRRFPSEPFDGGGDAVRKLKADLSAK